jgi:hypothetical protein
MQIGAWENGRLRQRARFSIEICVLIWPDDKDCLVAGQLQSDVAWGRLG